MKELSPAAQAALDAYRSIWPDEPLQSDEECLAAALRAVADKVVPEAAPPPMGWAESYARWNAQDDIRYELLAIANELENYNV